MSETFQPAVTPSGERMPDGTPQVNYDYRAHPGMQDPDPTTHTHVLLLPSIPLPGIVTVNGTDYDMTRPHAVPLADVDELAIKAHELCRALGYTTDPTPTIGPLAAAKAAFDAAG